MNDRPITDIIPKDVYRSHIFSLFGVAELKRARLVSRHFEQTTRLPLIGLLKRKRIKEVIRNNNSNTFLLTWGGDVWAFGTSTQNVMGALCDIKDPLKILSDVASMISRERNSFFVMKDKRLMICGQDQEAFTGTRYGRPAYIPGIDGVETVVIDAHRGTMLVLLDNGTVIKKGSNFFGAMDDDSSRMPTVPNLQQVCQIGEPTPDGLLFLHTDGTVSISPMYRLDLQTAMPEKVKDLKEIQKIVGPWLLGKDGNVYRFAGVNDNAYSIVLIPELNDIVDIFHQHSYHSGEATFFLTREGTVFACGTNNDRGQLGLGHKLTVLVPTPIPGLTNVSAVFTDHCRTVFLLKDRTVMTCGTNYKGALGLHDQVAEHLVPVRVPGLVNISSANPVSRVREQLYHQIFVDTEGQVLVQGDNTCRQLGMGDCVVEVCTPVRHPFFERYPNYAIAMLEARTAQESVKCHSMASSLSC